MEQHPLAVGQMLTALDFHLGPVQEFAMVGDLSQEDTRQVLQVIRGSFRPNKVVALKPAKSAERADEVVPLLAGKTASDTVTTYVCENFTCRAPLIGLKAATEALQAGK
jgi:uncharacterized protein YyaL (SSP411 family)